MTEYTRIEKWISIAIFIVGVATLTNSLCIRNLRKELSNEIDTKIEALIEAIEDEEVAATIYAKGHDYFTRLAAERRIRGERAMDKSLETILDTDWRKIAEDQRKAEEGNR